METWSENIEKVVEWEECENCGVRRLRRLWSEKSEDCEVRRLWSVMLGSVWFVEIVDYPSF